MENNFIISLLLSLLAGSATTIGGLMTIFAKKANDKIMSFFLSFSAGVMIYISFRSILPDAEHVLYAAKGQVIGTSYLVMFFLLGFLVVYIVDKFLPMPDKNTLSTCQKLLHRLFCRRQDMMKVGVITAITIALHNLPEGVATFTSAFNNLNLGLPIALAIAIHNIPEGIVVAMPIYYATKSRSQAFWWAALSGMTEPLGALLAYLAILPILSKFVISLTMSLVAGIMVYISLYELIPISYEMGGKRLSLVGIITGVIFMASGMAILAL